MALRKHLKKIEVEDKCKSSKDVFIQALYVHRTLRRQAGMCRGYWKKLQQLHATGHFPITAEVFDATGSPNL